MLHYRTITPGALGLLKSLHGADIFRDLRLVGGTALALQIGHRVSIDLDLFGHLDTDDLAIVDQLKKLGKVKIIQTTQNIKVFELDGVKVDIVNYPYPWLNEAIKEDDIVLAGIEDIAAMKLAAVSGRGAKKDFIDIYFLLKKYGLGKLFEYYHQKYSEGSSFLVLKSLTYFEDAEDELAPRMFIDVAWNDIKSFIRQEAAGFSK